MKQAAFYHGWMAKGLNPIDQHTLLMVQSEQEAGSTSFVDSSFFERTITGHGPQHSTEQAKFGSTSIKMNGGYLEIPDDPAWAFGSEFTVDFWWFPTSNTQNQGLYGQVVTNTNRIQLHLNRFGQIGIYIAAGGSVEAAIDWATSISLLQWHHFALVAQGSSMSLYVNGAPQSTASVSKSFTGNIPDISSPLLIGRGRLGEAWVNNSGYIEEFRVSNKALWSSPFTPPKRPARAG
jgi:hypothetical protein